jgi:hypothetical protein
MPLPPPGWYPDPILGSGERYWDGERWSEWFQSVPEPPVAIPDPGPEPAPEPVDPFLSPGDVPRVLPPGVHEVGPIAPTVKPDPNALQAQAPFSNPVDSAPDGFNVTAPDQIYVVQPSASAASPASEPASPASEPAYLQPIIPEPTAAETAVARDVPNSQRSISARDPEAMSVPMPDMHSADLFSGPIAVAVPIMGAIPPQSPTTIVPVQDDRPAPSRLLTVILWVLAVAAIAAAAFVFYLVTSQQEAVNNLQQQLTTVENQGLSEHLGAGRNV